MKTGKHTKGPISVKTVPTDIGRCHVIGDFKACLYDDGRFGGQSEQLANAERLVACWNACEGIEDPMELRAQRDELLVALQRAYGDAIQFLNEGDFKRRVEWDVAYITDAIARAEGKPKRNLRKYVGHP